VTNRQLICNITFISIVLAGCVLPGKAFTVDLSTAVSSDDCTGPVDLSGARL